jgi:acetyl-CoA acyltransferase
MRDVFIVGAYTIKFGKYPELGVKQLTAQAVSGVLGDAGIGKDALQSAFFSNSGWGMSSYQHCIRGQVALRPLGIDAIPITNVENACASGSTAFHGAWKDVGSGLFDVSLAIGAEKIHQANKYAVFAGFAAGTDVENIAREAARLGKNASQAAPSAEPAVRSANKPKRRKTLRERAKDLRDQAVVGITLGEALGYDQLRKLMAASGGGGKGKSKGKGGNRGDHSPFMDIYAYAAREHMRK